mgnify:CR=1 FL=1
MKIYADKVLKNYAELRPSSKESHASDASSGVSHNFDAITIQSDPRKIEEHTFAQAVSKELSSEVAKTASDEKIAALKEQIASRNYQIDPYAIASRILLVGEGA